MKLVYEGEAKPLYLVYGRNLIGGVRTYHRTSNTHKGSAGSPGCTVFQASTALSLSEDYIIELGKDGKTKDVLASSTAPGFADSAIGTFWGQTSSLLATTSTSDAASLTGTIDLTTDPAIVTGKISGGFDGTFTGQVARSKVTPKLPVRGRPSTTTSVYGNLVIKKDNSVTGTLSQALASPSEKTWGYIDSNTGGRSTSADYSGTTNTPINGYTGTVSEATVGNLTQVNNSAGDCISGDVA